MDVVRRLYVNITKSDGTDYTSADGSAILLYAKHRSSENVSEDYPYNHWDDDTHGAGSVDGALVGGSVIEASLDYINNGMWYYEMSTATLDAENEHREDFYFVKTGTASGYTGQSDVSWTMVDGANPKLFVTKHIIPENTQNIESLSSKVSGSTLTADALDPSFELAKANLPSALSAKLDAENNLTADALDASFELAKANLPSTLAGKLDMSDNLTADAISGQIELANLPAEKIPTANLALTAVTASQVADEIEGNTDAVDAIASRIALSNVVINAVADKINNPSTT